MKLKQVETGQKLMAITSNISKNILNQELSIQVSLSGLSFCILQRDTNTITYIKHIVFDKKLNPFEVLDQLKHQFNTENELQNTFKNVQVIHANELSTLVPKPLFTEDNLADYLKFNSKILKSDFIAYDSIVINDSVNVYVPYVNINNFIYDLCGSFTFRHSSTILIENILSIEKNSSIKKMYVNVNKLTFEIVVLNKNKLVLYNTFEYTTKEDFIYYVLFTAEQLELNPETFNLIFLGDIDAKDELYIVAKKYVRFVFLGNREDEYNYSIEAQPQSYHSDFTLIKSF
ncbi:DUF3822 family protein [Yeosuana marina]|uniref:DUF3822 family protein n=1 Tax=Yeosuana marina TaxID=1565536 RepID=UPI0030EF0243|tara:strand:+ start:662 stop:1525 length:864 start_codon:yes stop_codon:yes gene_type:complete